MCYEGCIWTTHSHDSPDRNYHLEALFFSFTCAETGHVRIIKNNIELRNSVQQEKCAGELQHITAQLKDIEAGPLHACTPLRGFLNRAAKPLPPDLGIVRPVQHIR